MEIIKEPIEKEDFMGKHKEYITKINLTLEYPPT